MMQVERLILETDGLGNLKHIPKLPPNKRVEVTFRVLDEAKDSDIKRRIPHPDLAGQIKILSDNIMDSVPESDWELLQ
ncbi:hypothetical protein [Laspinema olomoucense]|uniref:Uncharacterized protein n=1 Tax=Laspinema olomoucense D3b TaxID=2953688 RepID=A0ABT2NC13_9CYAN|nr:hypothetical protein [Laspinema sp. D3b]MCT7980026.1 hypothetical protein [Laspinema sp. D3b]